MFHAHRSVVKETMVVHIAISGDVGEFADTGMPTMTHDLGFALRHAALMGAPVVACHSWGNAGGNVVLAGAATDVADSRDIAFLSGEAAETQHNASSDVCFGGADMHTGGAALPNRAALAARAPAGVGSTMATANAAAAAAVTASTDVDFAQPMGLDPSGADVDCFAGGVSAAAANPSAAALMSARATVSPHAWPPPPNGCGPSSEAVSAVNSDVFFKREKVPTLAGREPEATPMVQHQWSPSPGEDEGNWHPASLSRTLSANSLLQLA